MASTISDYILDTKKMHPDAGVATNLAGELDYSMIKGNLYKRTITIDNTGKTVKSNYLVAFKLDTYQIYYFYKCGWNFNDLRVYDSDETTALPFYVEGVNTTYTTIYVKIPSLAAGSKNIFIYYGNPALKSAANITNTLGSVFSKTSLVAWLKSNDVNRSLGGGLVDNDLVPKWNNKASTVNIIHQPTSANRPTFKENIQNGQPAILSNGKFLARDALYPLKLQNNTEVTIFSVVYADTSLQRYTSHVRFQGGAGYVVNHYWNTADSTLKFLVSNDGGTGGISTGLSRGAWNLSGCHWKANTTNGFQTFNNGALVAQRNSNNSTLDIDNIPLHLFSFRGASEFYNGYSGDILVFSDFLTTQERTDVTTYLNAKFRIYDTADMPTITVGSESAATANNFNYLSYAPFTIWNSSQQFANKITGITKSTAKATIKDIFRKVISVGQDLEAWSNSTQDTTGLLSLAFARAKTATTTASIDEVRIDRPDGSNNLADLSQFNYVNITDSSSVYSSTDTDWIEHDFYCEDATKIDQAISYIRFENKNFLSYTETYNNAIWNRSGGIVSFTTGQTDPNGGTRATLINFGASQFLFQRYTTGYVLGKQFTFSGYLQGVPGTTITIALASRNAANAVLESAGISVTLTPSFQRFSTTVTLTSASSTMDKIQVGFSTFPSATATSVTLAFTQLESGGTATTYQPRLTDAAISYQAALNKNINLLSSGKLCVVKIKKSDFTKVGTGTWQDASYILKVNVKTTTASQAVKYGFFNLVKNFNADTNFDVSTPTRLRAAISSDNDATYYAQTVVEGRVVNREINGADTVLTVADYLEIVKNKTFSELASFPNNFAAFNTGNYLPGFAAKKGFHSEFLTRILSFIFPSTMINIDINFLPGVDTTGMLGSSLALADTYFPGLNYFSVQSTEKVGDVIDKLLGPTMGYLTYDQLTNKIVAKSGYSTFTNFNYAIEVGFDPFEGVPIYQNVSTLPDPYQSDIIYSYKDETSGNENAYIYNYIKFSVYADDFLTNYNFINLPGTQSYEIQAGKKTTVFLEDKDFLGFAEKIVILGNLYVSGWNVSTDSGSNVYNNANVVITSYGRIGNKVFVEFKNNNASTRWLRGLALNADILAYKKNISYARGVGFVTPPVAVYDKEIKEQASIDKYGKKEYIFDSYYSYAAIDDFGNVVYAKLYDEFIRQFKNQSNVVQIEHQYIPQARPGSIHKLRDKDGKLITCHTLKSEVYSEQKQTITMTVREILP